MPFKRLYAFDRVEDDWSLGVSEGPLRTFQKEVRARRRCSRISRWMLRLEQWFAFPRLGLGPSFLALAVEPAAEVSVLEDSAGNWFLQKRAGGREIRVIYESAIVRDVFRWRISPVSWETLRKEGESCPRACRPVAEQVLAHIGVRGAETPTHALRVLVDYFRQLSPSRTTCSLGKTRQNSTCISASSGKAFARRRAYAFMVTALGLGIPRVSVHNEAHAWVEVFGGTHYHRIDLGGAAARVHDFRRDAAVPEHRAPPDAFSWPAGANRGRACWVTSPNAPSSFLPPRVPEPSGIDPSTSESTLEITMVTHEKEVLRGAPLTVSGRGDEGWSALCALTDRPFALQ